MLRSSSSGKDPLASSYKSKHVILIIPFNLMSVNQQYGSKMHSFSMVNKVHQ